MTKNMPKNIATGMTKSIQRVLLAQVILAFALVGIVILATAVGAGGGAIMNAITTLGLGRATATAFGALLGILATLVTARSVLKSSRAVIDNPHLGPHLGMLPVYSGLLFKLFIVAGGAFAGLVLMALSPIYLVLGYITMQAGYFWAANERTP